MNSTCVIVVTYNGMPWIDQCLNSCKGYPVIVVDNQSTDETVSFIKQHYPKVAVLPQIKNLGFGAANNIGIKHAILKGANHVFLLNQDCYLQPDTINKLVKVHREHPEFGILSPIHLNGGGNKLDKNFSIYIKANDDILYAALKHDFLKTIYEIPFVNAAAWLLPVAILETVGGFDPIFFHYAEDVNYCQRVLFHGYKIGAVPDCYIFHDREYRQNHSNLDNKQKIIQKERYFKLIWANVNKDVDEDVKQQKRDLLKLVIKLFLKLKLTKMRYYISELALVKRIIPEIYKSRSINSQKGRHYL